MSKEQFIAMVNEAKNDIIEGEIIQAVLSQRFTVKQTVGELELYRALRYLNPSPYTFF